MPFEQRTEKALEAIRPRTERFQSALAVATEEIRGLLAGSGETADDHTVALGNFASGHVDVERFSAYTRKKANLEMAAEVPVRAAQKALQDLLRNLVVNRPSSALYK